MEKTNQVFSSEIIRTAHCHNNNLYELLNITPAKPLELRNEKTYTCDFTPRTDKIYVPKRKIKAKVKTVRDIRTTFENDIYLYLTSDLESQQNYLLKKIKDGSARNENIQNIAKKIFKSDTPISRSAWQMLINVNPHNNIHPQQFVLWNGKLIQVNGSKGGESKLLCSYDLANTNLPLQMKKKLNKNKISYKKKGLLRNSLAIKFKPGPLGRKKFLDDSHQTYHGDIELVDLPKVGLVIQPRFNTVIEPTITHFLRTLHNADGVISEKWAEFAVSVLGKSDRTSPRFNGDYVTFDLKYKCNQNRILMQKDLDKLYITPSVTQTYKLGKKCLEAHHTIISEVKDIMNKILDAVDININQDNMYTENEDLKQPSTEELNTVDKTFSKDKAKKRYCELDRLDVTVIRLPENAQKIPTISCGNTYCSLGCICDSLRSTYNFRQHCGREECMFNCRCDFYKYSNINTLDMNNSGSSNLLPLIFNIEKELHLKLAKEEEKFHQTVIETGEKKILLKSENRNMQSFKKYENIFKNMSLKKFNQRVLTISALRFNCENIEPWCMVHNLYKCFCKGKFTASCVSLSHQNIAKILVCKENTAKDLVCKDAGLDNDFNSIENVKKNNNTDVPAKPLSRLRRHDIVNLETTTPMNTVTRKTSGTSTYALEKKRKTLTVSDILNKRHRKIHDKVKGKYYKDESVSETSDPYDFYYSDYNGTCSRVTAYEGRKFSDEYYKNINYKIQEMEKNDKMLKKKIQNFTDDDPENNSPLRDLESKPHNENTQAGDIDTDKVESAVTSHDNNVFKFLYDINGIISCSNEDKSKKRLLSSENKLVRWLESNYKLYKKRTESGVIKSSLEPPKVGKIALHSWDFILSRYRERKNLFLISKQKPYRMFMGVHARNPFFESCININEIRFADLHKYPQTVKNLLTNATDLKDNFCILRGLSHCWELVGSVAKVNGNNDNAEEINNETSDTGCNAQSQVSDIIDESPTTKNSEDTTVQSPSLIQDESISECPAETESSKWFIMTVENDFTEIRFFKKGFFVKYESIIKAINVARISGKTVRLSSQKCGDKCNGPQFGIYAIPNASEYCVFIGPYEMEDSLGIETVKSVRDVGKTKTTKGYWMNTNKIDNLKVIDNPLSFIPLSDLKKNEAVPLGNHFYDDENISEKEALETEQILHSKEFIETQNKSTSISEGKKKIIKPITIRKTNGFYHLATGCLFKKMSLQSPHKVIIRPSLSINSGMIINNDLMSDTLPNNSILDFESDITSQPSELSKQEHPQIKIAAVYSQRDEQDLNRNKNEKGMFILKPEEINRRLCENQLSSEATSPSKNINTCVENKEANNIEYSLFQDVDLETSATLTPCTVNEDIYIISDDEIDHYEELESDHYEELESDNGWKQVLILCTDIPDLGWIWGRQKSNPLLLSFKVPEGEYTEFYTEDHAFKRINSELTKIICPAKPFNFRWRVIDSLDDLKTEVTPLDCKHLQKILELKGGQFSKSTSLLANASNNVKTYSRKNTSSSSRSSAVVESNRKTESPVTTIENNDTIDLVDEDCL